MAKKKKKPLSANQQAFKKEQNRLRAAQRRLEKQGYYFTKNIIPDLPKRITPKALKEIRELRPLDLRRAAVWVNPDTGEVVGTGLELYARQRRETSAKLAKAGRSKKNVSRLREYAEKRAGRQIESWESYNARTMLSYYEEQKRTSFSYDDSIVPHWRAFWPLVENTYGVQTVAECVLKIDGVPDPDGVPQSQQWLAYIRFSTDLLRELKKIGKVPGDIYQALDNIANAIEDETPIDDEVYDDLNWR